MIEKFKSQLWEIVTNNLQSYVLKRTNLENTRLYQLTQGEIPTRKELEALTAVADLTFLETMIAVSDEFYADTSEKDNIFLRTLFLYHHIQDKRNELGYTWADMEQKFGFDKQSNFRMKQRKQGKTSVATLKRLVGFADPEILDYIQHHFHDLNITTTDDVDSIANADDFFKKAQDLSVDDRIIVATRIVGTLNPDEFYSFFKGVFDPMIASSIDDSADSEVSDLVT